jgi:DNA-binding CsgD family transcriptional regulator
MAPSPASPLDQAPGVDSISRWVPPWVELLGMPVWVTGGDGNVVYVNERAEDLFGKSSEGCVGQPCHKIIGGRKPSGAPFCVPECAVRRLASHGREIEPYPLRLPRKNKRDDMVRVVVIVAHRPGDHFDYFVHCIVDDARHERFKKYIDKVVARSPHPSAEELSLEIFQLTRREREILRLLSDDETLHGIAHRLNLSYATVRNHVQHILTKLGVHSILEAVAFYLLVEE